MDNVFSFLKESAAKYPEKAFLVDRNKTLTFAQVYEKTCALAEHFADLGLVPGDRVLIYLDNSIEYIEAFFAVLKKGGIVVPVNKNQTIEVIDYIAQETSPVFIITNPIFNKRLRSGKKAAECNIVDIETHKTAVPDGCSEDMPVSGGDKPALILFTSGTTKMPKGVTLSHKNLIANTTSIVSYLHLRQDDSLLGIVNFCYSYGNSLLLTHTKAGARIVIENRVSFPLKVIEQLHESRVTGFSSVGSYLNILLKQAHLQPEHLQHLRYITFAGESTNMEDIAKLKELAPHLDVFVMYGQTEASARLSYLEPDMLFVKSGSVGRGIPGVTLRVVTEDGEEAMPGVVGEMTARGDNIMSSYWNNPEETKRVIKDGWLYTGDLALSDEDGFYYIKGRKDDLIKFMGHRISPVEIENTINSCLGVLETAVVAVTVDEQSAIKAFIVLEDSNLGTDTVNAFIKKNLPAFKRPQLIEFMDALPRTTSGKIMRSVLRKKANN